MEFEWDESKNRSNIAKHKVSFDEAKLIFAGLVLTFPDDRFDYGEKRRISIGRVEDVYIATVVHTDRNGVTRIISARPARQKERRLYNAYQRAAT